MPKPPASRRTKADPEAIVVAARAIARERGWAAVTIRALGERLGYASPVLYEHFRNKEDVLLAVARVGFAELEAALLALAPPIGTEARLLALGDAYVTFAREHPELYRVMHGLDAAVDPGAIDPTAVGAAAWRVCEIVAGEVEAWARAEGVALNALAAAETLWCLGHGLASLALAGRLPPLPSGKTGEPEAMAAFAIRSLLRGWRGAT